MKGAKIYRPLLDFRISKAIFPLIVLLAGCTTSIERYATFDLRSADHTGIDFDNTLTSTAAFNIYKYRNFYNGGGVAIGDVNNDGWVDIYFTANMQSNKLYINQGDFRFLDVTEEAGVAGSQAWSTGVSMVDINADGWLDIYVCNSGDVKGDDKRNEFFINQQNGTFKDLADELNLANQGFSTHAAFFDYDKDGDLDVYLVNNSYRSIGSFNLKENERQLRDEMGGDKLYRNDNLSFTDVSEESGIFSSEIGFGLGVMVADFDLDGWQDMYISNDFFERDYLYMNQGDGTFVESLTKQMRSISNASMGVDIADLNGDLYPEIFVNDMLPQEPDRYKTTMTFENWDKYQLNLSYEYHHQFTRNMLHENLGVVENLPIFREVGRLYGVEATDWSWTVLLTDFDLDRERDIYITNGIYQDILDQDFIQYIASEQVMRMVITQEGVNYKELIDLIPSNQIPNYLFVKVGEQYKNVASSWGLAQPSHSSGAAYGDLDNDGDPDLVVNNVNMPAFIYENNSTELAQPGYLALHLKGEKMNSHAIGSHIMAYQDGAIFFSHQHFFNRGFQSSVDPRIFIGLGDYTVVDSVIVKWHYGGQSKLENIAANQFLVFKEEDKMITPRPSKPTARKLFVPPENNLNQSWEHRESPFSDFDHDRLTNHMISNEGPALACDDVNGDQIPDLYLGGAKDQAGVLFLGKEDGHFQGIYVHAFEEDKASEDVSALFFDADNDGDQDLYVASGSNEFGSSSFALIDRLYFNNGNGEWSRSDQNLPISKPQVSSVVVNTDFDRDGDQDLFVGVRMLAGNYGVPASSFILKNNGSGDFTDVTLQKAPCLQSIGMVTDAIWTDFDLDNDEDLLIVGEWMSPVLLKNENGALKNVSGLHGLTNKNGWWHSLATGDFNHDGHPDFVLGNHGLNSRFRASDEAPIFCLVNDFDQNGSIEQITCSAIGEAYFPINLRHDLVMQLPELKKKILKYHDYKSRSLQELFKPEVLEHSITLHVTELASQLLLSNQNSEYDWHPLPLEAQTSPIYDILIHDLDGNGHSDLLIGGNQYSVKPEIGPYDAGKGSLLLGSGEGIFTPVHIQNSGLFLDGQVRNFCWISLGQKQLLFVVRNNETPLVYKHQQVEIL